jgi:hypothetical protein
VNPALTQYEAQLIIYGYENVDLVKDAEEQDLVEAFDELRFKNPHAQSFLKAYRLLTGRSTKASRIEMRVAIKRDGTDNTSAKTDGTDNTSVKKDGMDNTSVKKDGMDNTSVKKDGTDKTSVKKDDSTSKAGGGEFGVGVKEGAKDGAQVTRPTVSTRANYSSGGVALASPPVPPPKPAVFSPQLLGVKGGQKTNSRASAEGAEATSRAPVLKGEGQERTAKLTSGTQADNAAGTMTMVTPAVCCVVGCTNAAAVSSQQAVGMGCQHCHDHSHLQPIGVASFVQVRQVLQDLRDSTGYDGWKKATVKVKDGWDELESCTVIEELEQCHGVYVEEGKLKGIWLGGCNLRGTSCSAVELLKNQPAVWRRRSTTTTHESCTHDHCFVLTDITARLNRLYMPLLPV